MAQQQHDVAVAVSGADSSPILSKGAVLAALGWLFIARVDGCFRLCIGWTEEGYLAVVLHWALDRLA